MLFTEPIVIFFKELQPPKALSSITVIPSGIENSRIYLSSKGLPFNMVTERGNSIPIKVSSPNNT